MTAEELPDDALVVVDSHDRAIATISKADAHRHDGVLHRAFSIYLFNSAGEVLLQQRSEKKPLWPGFWSNSCCSHPRAGEDEKAAAQRRLREELGVSAELQYLYKFPYHARYLDVGSEYEMCWVWYGVTDAAIAADRDEISAWRFCPAEEVDAELERTPERFTPWLKLAWPRVRAHHRQATEDLPLNHANCR